MPGFGDALDGGDFVEVAEGGSAASDSAVVRPAEANPVDDAANPTPREDVHDFG